MHTPALARRMACAIVLLLTAIALSAQTPIQVEESEPLVTHWVPAVMPAELGEVDAGRVTVDFVVLETGGVTDVTVVESSDPRLDPRAIENIKQWTFDPAVRSGRPSACGMRTVLEFQRASRSRTGLLPPHQPEVLPLRPARLVRPGHVDDPYMLVKRQLGGVVILEFEVDAEGRGRHPRVLAAANADLIPAAVRGLLGTQFEPATQGSLKLPSKREAPFEFDAHEDLDTRLRLNGLGPAIDAETQGVKTLPSPIVYADPVYPYDRLVQGEEGHAQIEFTVDAAGLVKDVQVTEASQPEFGSAVEAAIHRWRFEAARSATAPVVCRMRWLHRFTRPTAERDPQLPLLAALQPGGRGIGGAKGLDAQLVPIHRAVPRAPDALGNEEAQAEVEFIVDREGRARLPKIRRASHEAYGWAAAAAVAEWTFIPPTRGGQPTEVKVAVPINRKAGG